jgi:hypothetical protein
MRLFIGIICVFLILGAVVAIIFGIDNPLVAMALAVGVVGLSR